jgi:hypothetical protein
MNRNVAKKNAKQPKRQRIGRLKSAADVQKFIARMIKRIARGEGVADAYKACVAAGVLLKAVELTSLEERISLLEKSIGGKNE